MPLAANVQAMLADLPTEAGSAPEVPGVPPPAPGASGTDPASVGAPEAAPERETKRALLSEKLAEVRERRKASQLEKQARETSIKAKGDADVAASERAKWEGLRSGTFVEGMKALGRDPRVVLDEMKREALESGTPEAQIRQMQERFDVELKRIREEEVAPLRRTLDEERQAREAESKRAAEKDLDRRFASDFDRIVKEDTYRSLVVEYGEDRLLELVHGFVTTPGSIVGHAKALNVSLTHADGRFSMKEALTVLARAQEEHEAQKQRRAQAVATPKQAGQGAPEKKPTVNGTVTRPGNPLGNEPASSRASGAPEEPRLTRRQRVQKLIDDGGGATTPSR